MTYSKALQRLLLGCRLEMWGFKPWQASGCWSPSVSIAAAWSQTMGWHRWQQHSPPSSPSTSVGAATSPAVSHCFPWPAAAPPLHLVHVHPLRLPQAEPCNLVLTLMCPDGIVPVAVLRPGLLPGQLDACSSDARP